MRRVTIPNTALSVSPICMGTVTFGSGIGVQESFEILDRFAELGGNFLDTARIYANWLPGAEPSASEKTLGKWMKERRNADRIVVATKGAHPLPGSKKPTLERADLAHQVEESCRNLCVDTIPLYYLHRDDEEIQVAYIMDTLFLQQDLGRIRYLGCSNWRAERIEEANEYAAKCGRTGFVAVSNRWSLAKYVEGVGDTTLVDMNEALYKLHQQSGIAAIPFSSTASGYLSKLAAGTSIRDSLKKCYDLPENDTLALRAKKLAANKGITVAQLALCYFYSQPFTAIPVTAFSSENQMMEAVQAADITLTAEEYAYLTAGV